jgi:hypothetical protein
VPSPSIGASSAVNKGHNSSKGNSPSQGLYKYLYF